jgi:hypothetical protein
MYSDGAFPFCHNQYYVPRFPLLLFPREDNDDMVMKAYAKMVLWIVDCAIVVLVLSFCSTPNSTSFVKAQTQELERAAQTEALIDKLALRRPPGTSSREAERTRNDEMVEAWLELRDIGPQAFSKVIEHLEDKRPSFTEDSGSTMETWTVGRACFDVLWCTLEPYNWGTYSSSVPPEKYWWRPNYCTTFLKNHKKARAWLAAHKGKSLVDLQIEVLEWVTSNRSKRKVEISIEDRQQLLAELDTLRRTRKPLKPAVPWSR